ncbi:MAG: response regulator [Thermomicrobiales bacterium]
MVVGPAGSIAEARDAPRLLLDGIDMAVIDLCLPDGDGVQVVRHFREHHPHGRPLVLTAVIDLGHHRRALEAGALWVISKGTQLADIVRHLRRTLAFQTSQPASGSPSVPSISPWRLRAGPEHMATPADPPVAGP